jgi:hypothetical protein
MLMNSIPVGVFGNGEITQKKKVVSINHGSPVDGHISRKLFHGPELRTGRRRKRHGGTSGVPLYMALFVLMVKMH